MQVYSLLSKLNPRGLLIFFTAVLHFWFESFALAAASQTFVASDRAGQKSALFGDQYIRPNEREFYSFNPSLQSKPGALVAVGTFRFFHDLSQGNFELGISLDYSSLTTDFNRGLMKIFLAAQSGREFLSILSGQPAEFHRALAAFDQSLLSKESLLKLLHAHANSGARNAFFRKYFPPSISIAVIQRFTARLVDFYADPLTRNSSFLGSDLFYDRIRNLIQKNLVVVINGNLAGKYALRQIAKILKQNGAQVSALDISNAYKYIANQWHGSRNFLENLKALPFSEDAVVLVTQTKRFVSNEWTWDYYAFPQSSYLAYLEYFGREQSYLRFLHGEGRRYKLRYDSSFCHYLF